CRWNQTDDTMTARLDKVHNFLLRFLVQRRVAHESAAADIFALQFKLRFDERQNHTVWSYQLESVGQDQSQRDERNINDAKIDRYWDVCARRSEEHTSELQSPDHLVC